MAPEMAGKARDVVTSICPMNVRVLFIYLFIYLLYRNVATRLS
jgi:hypothetical protein